MTMTLKTIRDSADGAGFEMVFDDAGSERVAFIGPTAPAMLLQLLTPVVGPLGAIRADKVLLSVPKDRGIPFSLGVRSEYLGEVFFALPWDALRGLADAARKALEETPPLGSA